MLPSFHLNHAALEKRLQKCKKESPLKTIKMGEKYPFSAKEKKKKERFFVEFELVRCPGNQKSHVDILNYTGRINVWREGAGGPWRRWAWCSDL